MDNTETIPDKLAPTICQTVVALTRLSQIEELQLAWLYERYPEILDSIISFRKDIASASWRVEYLLDMTVLPVADVASTLEYELLAACEYFEDRFEGTLDLLEWQTPILMSYALPVINDPDLPPYFDECRDIFQKTFKHPLKDCSEINDPVLPLFPAYLEQCRRDFFQKTFKRPLEELSEIEKVTTLLGEIKMPERRHIDRKTAELIQALLDQVRGNVYQNIEKIYGEVNSEAIDKILNDAIPDSFEGLKFTINASLLAIQIESIRKYAEEIGCEIPTLQVKSSKVIRK